MISGTYGVGKSSLLTYLLNLSAFDHKRINESTEWLNKFNKEHGYNIPAPSHYTFSTIDMTFKRAGHYDRKAHKLYPKRFGVQSEAPKGFKCQFMPKGSTLGWDEIQKDAPSRNGDIIPNYFFSGFEQHRHVGIKIYATTPAFMLVDVRIRRNATGIFIKKRNLYKRDGLFKLTLTCDVIPIGLIDFYVGLKPEELESNRNIIKEEEIVIDFDIYKLYNPYAHLEDFYAGLNESDCVIEQVKK